MKFNHDFSSRFRILKGGKISLVVSVLLGGSTLCFAAPSGESVVSGNLTIDRATPQVTNINQSSQKSIINWQSFNVAGNETVNFNMPSSTSSSLNRVIGNEASAIYGKINSNGQLFLVNQNGVYFSKDSQVNTAGFVASTQNISDENFLNGNYVFEGNSDASIINLGTITTDNAYTALLAKKVENEGVIKAHLGSVQLASGEKFTLDINGNSLVKLTIDKGTLDGLVANKGAIIADGGEIYLTTSALDEVLSGLVNNTGVIQANAVEEKDGKIILFAHGGTGEFGGSIEAVDGFVETSGKEFVNKADLSVKAKEWLIDPVNITIDSTLAGTISSALASGSVTVTTEGNNNPSTTAGEAGTDGDIFVNSAISWSSANDLTLSASRDIYINDSITATDAGAKLTLEYGQGAVAASNLADYYLGNGVTINLQAGQNFSTRLGSDGTTIDYTVIEISDNTSFADLAGNYALGKDHDFEGLEWTPIGDSTTPFTGRFDGLGHRLDGYRMLPYTIDDTNNQNIIGIETTASNIGFFGYTYGATIQNLNIDFVEFGTSGQNVGALIGTANMTTVNNITLGADVLVWSHRLATFDPYAEFSDRDARVGGLIGLALGGSVSNITSSAQAYGDSFDGNEDLVADRVGGVIGETRYGATTSDTITLSNITVTSDAYVYARDRVGGVIGYANTGTILRDASVGEAEIYGNQYVGGIVGYARSSTLENLVSNAEVDGVSDRVGGLVGYNIEGTISDSYATGDVSGASDVGGLVGYNDEGTISNSYASVTVDGIDRVGGLVGQMYDGTISNSYATGAVSGANSVGGLLGTDEYGTITNSYATGDVEGSDYVGGLLGADSDGTITNSYATGAVSGVDSVGGLVGDSFKSSINKSYASGDVTSSGDNAGGLIGYLSNTNLSEVYASGDVTVEDNALNKQYYGGLVGKTRFSQSGNFVIENVYATGDVKASGSYVGGLFGNIVRDEPQDITLLVKNSYAIGTVEGGEGVGKIVGDVWDTPNDASWDGVTFENVFYNSDSIVTAVSQTIGYGVGKTTADMKKLSTYSTWGSTIVEDASLTDVYPQLRWATSGLSDGDSVWVIAQAPVVVAPQVPITPEEKKTIDNIVSNIILNIPTPPPAPKTSVKGGKSKSTVTTTVDATNTGSVAPQATQKTMTQIVKAAVPELSGSDASFTVVSEGTGAVTKITMEQLLEQVPSGFTSEIRVVLAPDSFVTLVNGGVNLGSISQEFYIVEEK